MSKLLTLILLLLGTLNLVTVAATEVPTPASPRPELTDIRLQLLPAELDVNQLVSDPELFHAFELMPAGYTTFRVNNDQALWLKFKLHNPGTQHWPALLLYPFLPVDHISFYRINPELTSTTLLSRSGSLLPFAERPLPLLRFNQPVEIPAGETLTLLLRLQDAALLSTQLQLSTLAEAIQYEQKSLLQESLLGGLLIVLSVLALLSCRLPGAQAFVWLGGFYASYLMIIAILHGQAFRFIWPNYPEVNPVILYVTVGINLLMLSLFCRSGFQLAINRYQRLSNNINSWLAILLLFSPLFIDGPLMLQWLFISVSLCLTINIVQAIWITLTTERADTMRYTFICTLAALCLLLLQIQHLTSHTSWFNIGIAISLLLMAMFSQQIITQRPLSPPPSAS